MAQVTADPIPGVRSGVFFTTPAPLPRGRHGLSRDTVRAAQRERLMAAATELLAASGYRGFGAGDVARRAGVSLAAFYDNFTDKDAAVFAGYDRFIDVLLGRLTRADVSSGDRVALSRTLLMAYLETLQADLVVARAYQVEIDSLGPTARERRRDSLERFAAHLREVIGDAALPDSAYLGVVYAARQLASDALDREPAPDLVALGDDLTTWVADLFRVR
jgi:AcrR family transcriptional regulator